MKSLGTLPGRLYSFYLLEVYIIFFIGFAFQIIDDILDVSGDKDVVGKDLSHDSMNYVKLVGIEEANKRAQQYTENALNALQIFGAKAEELKAFSAFLTSRVN